jgi:hypothetical protein
VQNLFKETRATCLASKLIKFCVISRFRREVDEICVLLGYYAASSGNLLPTFRGNRSVPSSGVENRHVGKKLSDSLSNNPEERILWVNFKCPVRNLATKKRQSVAKS